MDLTLTELEEAINYWRKMRPSIGEERALSPEVNTLADVYARMIFAHLKSLPMALVDARARQLLEDWRARAH